MPPVIGAGVMTSGPLATRFAADVGHGAVLIVPLGSLTTVSPVLPAGTAIVLATRFADELARRLGPVALVAPPMGFGVVGVVGAAGDRAAAAGDEQGAAAGDEQGAAAGGVGVSADTMARMLVDVASSALAGGGRGRVREADTESDRDSDGDGDGDAASDAAGDGNGAIAGVMFVNADGANLPALRRAGHQLLRNGKRAYHWSLRSDEHGLGRTIIDACLLLHLAPHLVAERVEDLRPIPSHELGESLFHDYSDDLEHAVRGLFDV